MSHMKRILDSVHGYIIIPEEYCDNIIDTIQFQRLRRIEQTSIRSIFPCARHDRFMHSLGVYHMGCKILQQLQNQHTGFVTPEYDEIVFESYKLACLLHDVCHSPFSHTFEKYYNKTKLFELLNKELKDESFSDDYLNAFDDTKPHEIMSALMVIRIYGTWIKDKTKADVSLIVRMITGVKFNIAERSFEDAMIELIHGKVDADGMDYACRDVWASGYCTSMVDIERLIGAISIINVQGKWELVFNAKAKNEIEGFLNVKTFQYDYVFSHHTILYEQELLVEAMKSAALYHLRGEKNVIDEDAREKALYDLCNVESFYACQLMPHSRYPLYLPMDDDFVAMMKYIPEDKYVKQWLSRRYEYRPLWKTRSEWLSLFPIELSRILTRNQWFDADNLKQRIYDRFKAIEPGCVIVSEVSLKNKLDDAKDLMLYTNLGCISFKELFKEEFPYHSDEYPNEGKIIPIPRKSDYVYVYLMETDEKQIKAILDGIKEMYMKDINNI